MAITATVRHYPQLPTGTHPEVQKAFDDVHDKLFSLRDELQSMQRKQAEAKPDKPSQTSDILGIPIQAATDPTSLKDGMVVTYSAAINQFIFKAP